MDSLASSSKETLQPDPLTEPLEALYWTQYGTWYPIFRKHAPKSTVIDIQSVQPELLDWLDSETFVLPEGSGPSTTSASAQTAVSSSCSSSSSGTSVDAGEESEDEEQDEVAPVKLPSMDAAIRTAIDKFDGIVFPKLNWSAPQDASFMLAGNTLCCQHPEDVYLLLKSSEFIGRDLEQISHLSSPRITPQLVLKKWFALNRSYEFRCFIRSHRLIAISQRDVTFYDHLQDAYLQNEIRGVIWDFYEDVLMAKKDEGEWRVGDYVVDVYCTKELARVWLVDVNAWLPRTDALLWGWDELDALHLREKSCRPPHPTAADALEEGVTRIHLNPQAGEERGWDESDVKLRVVSDRRMQSAGGSGATYSSNMVPKDLVDFARTGAGGQATVDQIVSRWNAQVDSEQ